MTKGFSSPSVLAMSRKAFTTNGETDPHWMRLPFCLCCLEELEVCARITLPNVRRFEGKTFNERCHTESASRRCVWRHILRWHRECFGMFFGRTIITLCNRPHKDIYFDYIDRAIRAAFHANSPTELHLRTHRVGYV